MGLNLMRRHDIKRNAKIIQRKIIPPQNGLLKTRYRWRPWSVTDAGQPQLHLGRPALYCGVKITAVAGNWELLFYLSSILTFFQSGHGGKTISLYLGNINAVTEVLKKKVYLQNRFCLFCCFFSFLKKISMFTFPPFSLFLLFQCPCSHKLSSTPRLDKKVYFSPDDLDGKCDQA